MKIAEDDSLDETFKHTIDCPSIAKVLVSVAVTVDVKLTVPITSNG
jgi:hypothetical protein